MRRPFRAIGLDSFILYGIEWETAFVSASSYILAPLKSSLRTIDNRRNSGCPGKGEGSVWIRYLGVGQRFRLWNSSLPIPPPHPKSIRNSVSDRDIFAYTSDDVSISSAHNNSQDIYKSFSSLFFFPSCIWKDDAYI